MTIPVFPTLTQSYPVRISDAFKTNITEFGEQVVQRNSLRRFPLRQIVIPFGKMPVADRNTLFAFFRARRGSGEAFWYVHNRSQGIYDEYMGMGDGGALTLDLHSKSTVVANLVVYEDGVAQVKDTDYTFVSGGGEAGVDRITWIVGNYPAEGALITFDATGLLRIKAYLGDSLDDEWFRHLHSKAEITLFEEQW